MNGLKEEFPVQLRVVSVDVQSRFGRELTQEYGKFTPTFVLFDSRGKELWRVVGSLDPAQVRQYLE